MSEVMIEARNLTKRYGEFRAIEDVSFEVHRGEVLGFLGPNGAGKTTTMKILTCFMAPSSGQAKVNGHDVFDDSLAVRQSIGYLPEHNPLYTEMVVIEYLDFICRMRQLQGEDGPKAIKRVVEQAGLGDVLGKPIRTLSRGYRQRVGLAQALMHQPPIMILDEPLSGLDPNQASEIRDLIKSIGKERTVILSTHNLAEVTVTCDRVLIISKGKIVADDKTDALMQSAGKPRFSASVLHDGKEGKAKEAFSQIQAAASVETINAAEPGQTLYEFTAKDNTDLRPEIFRAAARGDFTLVELQRQGQNLEEIFHDLTTREDLSKSHISGPKSDTEQATAAAG